MARTPSKLGKVMRRVSGRGTARRRGVILMYHRVARLESDVHRLAVTPERFRDHLRLMAEGYTPMRLNELVDAAGRGALPSRAVAVTLDDGYVDNAVQALPIIDETAVPATMFIVTGQVGRRDEFWWDELEHRLLRQGPVPDRLSLDIAGDTHEWDTSTPAGRRRTHHAAHLAMLPLEHREQQRVLESLAQWTGARRGPRPGYRVFTPEELHMVAGHPLVDIGAHTVTHTSLAARTDHEQRTEIEQSKQWLEERLGEPIGSLSYPYGHYAAATPGIASGAGIDLAVTADPRTVGRRAERLTLGRFAVQDWDAAVFERRLSEFFAA